MGEGTINGGFWGSEFIQFPKGRFDTQAEIDAYDASMELRIAETALSGEIVAVQRNFDADGGRVLDVYKGGGLVGYIHQEFEDMRCEVYVADKDGMPVPLDQERIAFDEASLMLEAYVNKLPVTVNPNVGLGFGLDLEQ